MPSSMAWRWRRPPEKMNNFIEVLLWPVVLFLQAIVGVLGRPKAPGMAVYQKIARMALLGCVGVFCLIPLFMLAAPPVGVQPLLVVGATLLILFVVFGNLCETEDDEEDDGAHGRRR